MSKHIHIHINRARQRDAGFNEGEHKRDKDGKFASKAGAGTETHHSKLSPGMGIYNKAGQKVDEVHSLTPAMHAAERTVHTRAGYEHVTQGGHLPGGMHVKSAKPAVTPERQKQLNERQAMLREMASPRHSGNTAAIEEAQQKRYAGGVKEKIGGREHEIHHDGKHYRSGAMRSTTLQGLRDLITKTVK